MRRFAATWLLVFLSLSAHAKPRSSAIVDLAHIELYFLRMAENFEEAAKRNQVDTQISKSQKEQIASFAQRIYTVENLMIPMRENYVRSLVSSRDVNRWFTSVPGLRYSQARGTAVKKFSSTLTKESFLNLSATLKLTPNRTNTLKTFSLNWQEGKTLAIIMEGLDIAWVMATSKVKAGQTPLSVKAASEMVKGRRDLYLSDADRVAVAISALTFTGFSGSKVDELGSFPLTTAGLNHLEAVHKSLEQTLKNAAKTLQKQL
jgi:hypothetical protein